VKDAQQLFTLMVAQDQQLLSIRMFFARHSFEIRNNDSTDSSSINNQEQAKTTGTPCLSSDQMCLQTTLQ